MSNLPNRLKKRTPKQQQLIDDRQRATTDIERLTGLRPQQRDVMTLVVMRREGKSTGQQKKFIESLKDKYPPPRIRTNTRKTFKSLIPRPKSASPKKNSTPAPSMNAQEPVDVVEPMEAAASPVAPASAPSVLVASPSATAVAPKALPASAATQPLPAFKNEFSALNEDEYDPFTMY